MRRNLKTCTAVLAVAACGCSQQLYICNLTSEPATFTAEAQAGFDENLGGIIVDPCSCELFTERPVQSGRPETTYTFGDPQTGDGPHLNVTLPEYDDSFASAEMYYIAYHGEGTPSEIGTTPPQCGGGNGTAGIMVCNLGPYSVYIWSELEGYSEDVLLAPGECRVIDPPEAGPLAFNAYEEERHRTGDCDLTNPSDGDRVGWNGKALQCTDN